MCVQNYKVTLQKASCKMICVHHSPLLLHFSFPDCLLIYCCFWCALKLKPFLNLNPKRKWILLCASVNLLLTSVCPLKCAMARCPVTINETKERESKYKHALCRNTVPKSWFLSWETRWRCLPFLIYVPATGAWRFLPFEVHKKFHATKPCSHNILRGAYKGYATNVNVNSETSAKTICINYE